MLLLDAILGSVSPERYELLSRIRRRSQLANRVAVYFGDLLRNRDLSIERGPGKGVLFNPGHGYISQVLGTWEPAVIDAIGATLQPGMVFYDIGANNGFFSIIGAKVVGPEGAVYAIEPLPLNIRQIKHNVELNDFQNIHVHQIAMGGENGTAKLSVSANSGMSRLEDLNDSPAPDWLNTVTVELRTLDSLIGENCLRDPDFIKIDAEGAETMILKGAVNTIQRCHPFMLIELHGTNRSVQEMLDYLGYSAVSLENQGASIMDVGVTGHIIARPGPLA